MPGSSPPERRGPPSGPWPSCLEDVTEGRHRERTEKELEDHLDAAVELAAQCGVSALELMEMLRILLKEEEPHV